MLKAKSNEPVESLLKVVGLSKRLKGQPILTDISFQFFSGSRMAIAGETGSGKTTLLRIISGFMQADQGVAYFGGEKILGPLDQLMPGTKGLMYLSQQFELPNNYQVLDILNYENRLDTAKAEHIFRVCKIDHLLRRRTNELSGGEKQRIALSRLLIAAPKLILLDEPFSNLDPIHKQLLKETLNNVSQQLNVDCLLVSHDPIDTLSWATDIVVLKDGRVLQQGSPNQIYYHPVNEYVAGLFGRFNLLSPELAKILNISPAEKKKLGLIVRPSQIKLKLTDDPEEGFIEAISFSGTIDEVNIKKGKTNLIVFAIPGKFRVGDYVELSLRKKV